MTNLYKAQFDYEAVEEGDLNLSANDVIEYLYNVSQNWYIGYNIITNKTGAFPYNFVEKINIPSDIDLSKVYIVLKEFDSFNKGDLVLSIQQDDKEIYASKIEANKISIDINFIPITNVTKLFFDTGGVFSKYTTKCEFKSSNSDQLSYKLGDIIWIYRKFGDSIGRGYCNGEKGYVKLGDLTFIQEAGSESSNKVVTVNRKNRWICLYDYETDVKTDLVVNKGDNLIFIDKIDENWYLMQNVHGKVGMVPFNYLRNISILTQPSIDKDERFIENHSKRKLSMKIDRPMKTDINKKEKRYSEINFDKRDILRMFDNGSPVKSDSEVTLDKLENQEKDLLDELDLISINIQAMKNRIQKKTDNETVDDNEDIEMIRKNLSFLLDDHKIRTQELEGIKDRKMQLLKGDSCQDEIDTNQMKRAEKEKQLRMRSKAIEELVVTEKKFHNDIHATLQAFDKKEMANKISMVDYEVLFGELESILDLSKRFYDDLMNVTLFSYEDALIGDLFLKFMPYFDQVYEEYCLNYDKKLALISKNCGSNEKWDEAVQNGIRRLCASESTQIVRLEDMLSKPFQRFLKYPLFLKTIKQNTPTDHPDSEGLIQAHEQIQEISRKCNEKKRFEELKTSIFVKDDQEQYVKVMHSIRKVPKRLVTSMYVNPATEDREFNDIVTKFKNTKKSVSFFIDTVILLRTNMKEVMNLYSSITSNTESIARTHFGSLLSQYLLICKNDESEYNKTYSVRLDSRVLNPLMKLLELFSGPTLLIKKRQNKFLDYSASKQKIEGNSKETTRAQQDKVSELYSQYKIINDTLKLELPLLISQSNLLLNECAANFLQQTTQLLTGSIRGLSTLLATGDMPADEFLRLCRIQQTELLTQMNRAAKCPKLLHIDFGASRQQRKDLGITDPALRSAGYTQTPKDVTDLCAKHKPDQLMISKRDFRPTKPHQVHINTGDIVGVLKRCDHQNNAINWLVEVSPANKRMGFVPRSCLAEYSNLSEFSPSRNVNLGNGCVRSTSMKLYGGTLTVNNDHFNSPRLPNNQASNSITMPRQSGRMSLLCDTGEDQSLPDNIRTALYKHSSRGPSEVSIEPGNRVQLLRQQDNVGNKQWCLVRNLVTNEMGYVPTNYLSSPITIQDNAQARESPLFDSS